MNKPDTASFDIIGAASHSYKTLWDQREYVKRLIIIPVILKAISLCFVLFYSGYDNHMKNALILLPAYMAEGWMIAHWIRYVALGQYWPFRPTGDEDKDLPMLEERARGILSAMIVFVLLQLCMAVFWTFLTQLPIDPETVETPDLSMRFFSIALIIFIVWAFRYLWLYIPLALNYPLWQFIKDTANPKLSLFLMGVWLLCVIPGFVFMFTTTMPLMLDTSEAVPAGLKIMGIFAQAFLEAIINLLAVGGIFFGLKDMYTKHQKTRR